MLRLIIAALFAIALASTAQASACKREQRPQGHALKYKESVNQQVTVNVQQGGGGGHRPDGGGHRPDGDWHRPPGGGWYRPPHGPNAGDIIGGFIIGNAISNWLFPPKPQVIIVPEQQRFAPWTPDWYDYCIGKYRSFDAKTGYFQGFDSVPHFCK